MIALNGKKDEGSDMIHVIGKLTCDEKDCKSVAPVKLHTQVVDGSLVWQIDEPPTGWIATSIKHATCPICLATKASVLVIVDNDEETAKLQYLAELHKKIADLKAKRALSQLDTPFPHMQSHP